MKKIVGEEREKQPPFNVECPRCGAQPGEACRKPSGQIQYDTQQERRRKAGGTPA